MIHATILSDKNWFEICIDLFALIVYAIKILRVIPSVKHTEIRNHPHASL